VTSYTNLKIFQQESNGFSAGESQYSKK
jgi:hypothetical protein